MLIFFATHSHFFIFCSSNYKDVAVFAKYTIDVILQNMHAYLLREILTKLMKQSLITWLINFATLVSIINKLLMKLVKIINLFWRLVTDFVHSILT